MNTVPRTLRIAYVRSTTTKIETLNTLWVRARIEDWSPETVGRLMEFAHRIGNTGSSYGYAGISRAAYRLQHLLEENGPRETRLASLFDARRELENALKAAARDGTALFSLRPNRTELAH